jgi:hypothetical protein
MKRLSVFLFATVVVLGLALFFISNLASAAEITVYHPFHFREHESANSVGFTPGDLLFFGAQSVIPNGNNGTTGVATQGSVTRPLTFYNFTVSPNQFAGGVMYNPALTGEWLLTFSNGSHTATALTPPVGDAPMLPFVSSVAISGSGPTPTFTWTLPSGFTPDGIRVQIWDLQEPVANLRDVIFSRALPGNTTSFTIPDTFPLEQGHLYSIEISPVLTRGVPLGDNSTLLSRARAWFDFVPLPEGSPPNVFLPIVTPGPVPVYTFNVEVVGGQTIFIDPAVAVGYDYAIGTGNPNFASVTLPTGIGDNWYQLYLFNGTKYYFKAFLKGGVPYSFPSGGIDRFRILGIERDEGLDPNNPTAFITGLTFTGSGNFTGSMTPVTACFNPSVAGSGWIQSPAGAYTENPALNGYAIFGLISKIKGGSTVPWGNAGFVFPVGHLWFYSDKYESLESNTTGTKVQLKGTGTINGSGGYSFIIWAGDKSKMWGEDTFRIQIWETATGEVVYDNEANQEIAGGLIQIFKQWTSCE